MDDIHLDDPRKFSAKQIKVEIEQSVGKRSVWQYLFDLLVKTFILAALISIDFTLFAKAGNYKMFTSTSMLTLEVQYIYATIALICFVVMLLASFRPKLENAFLSLGVALTVIAIINQFATFEKHSGLLIFFSGIFSDQVNGWLYEYSFWIIGLCVFALAWFIMNRLRRSIMFYMMCGLALIWGWILSEAYFNTSSQYFRTVASSPTLKDETSNERLVFLSFNNLTSPNNLQKMSTQPKQNINMQKSLGNLLGMLTEYNFILYPNALAKNSNDEFLNLMATYNFGSADNDTSYVMNSAMRDEYFDFSALQDDKLYVKDNALYSLLQKEGYKINVYQTRDVDTCYVNNKLAAATCLEKVNMPIALDDPKFTRWDKTFLLAAQWLNSTGFVKSFNPLLKGLEYIIPGNKVKPIGGEVDRLYAINSFKVFDLIAENMKKQTGKQAYFAVIDLPSDTYVYDEFCQIKEMSAWMSETNAKFANYSIEERRNAYADQLSCGIGALASFIQQLEDAGQLENSTIIINALGNPHGILKKESEYYPSIQENRQVLFAIRPKENKQAQIDYKVCRVDELVNSYLATKKPCQEFSDIKTTEKNMKQIQSLIEKDKYKDHEIESARENFVEWMRAWVAYNKEESNFNYGQIQEITATSQPMVIEKVEVAENVVEEKPEEKLPSISKAAQDLEAKTEDDAATQNEVKTETGGEPKVDANSITADVDTTGDKTINIDTVEAKLEDQVTDPAKQPAENKQAAPEDKASQEDKSTAEAGKDVVPETLFDSKEEYEAATKESVETPTFEPTKPAEQKNDNVATDDNKPNQKEEVKDKPQTETPKTPEENLDKLVKDVENLAESKNLKEVLEAPVVEEQKLSPEELKKQFREKLSNTTPKPANDIDIKVKVVEN